jgi:hypothetical protein
MCRSDVGLLTYDWMPQFRRPWPNFEISHECANWDAIQEWAVEHSFNGFDPNLIKHPNFHLELSRYNVLDEKGFDTDFEQLIASPFSYAVSGNDIPH